MLSQLRRLEIELHSFCNRKCEWCPNKELDRTFYNEMEEDVYLNLIYDLRDNNYGINNNVFSRYNDTFVPATISFIRFNEPMANTDLLSKRIKQAREILGRGCYVANTNGDYLSKENLNKLDLDFLNVMDYDCKGRDYWVEKFKELGILLISKHNKPFGATKKENLLFGASKTVSRIAVAYDFPKYVKIENRAGALNEVNVEGIQWKNNRIVRDYPCIEPKFYASISYDGSVAPCCHIRQDYEPHKPYIFGNIHDKPLSQILTSKEWIDFGNIVFDPTSENFPEICKYCHKERKWTLIENDKGEKRICVEE